MLLMQDSSLPKIDFTHVLGPMLFWYPEHTLNISYTSFSQAPYQSVASSTCIIWTDLIPYTS